MMVSSKHHFVALGYVCVKSSNVGMRKRRSGKQEKEEENRKNKKIKILGKQKQTLVHSSPDSQKNTNVVRVREKKNKTFFSAK